MHHIIYCLFKMDVTKDFWKFCSFKQEKYVFDIKQLFQTKILPWTELIQVLSGHEFTVGERKLLSVKLQALFSWDLFR